MLKNKSLKISTMLFLIVLLSVSVLSQPASALVSQNVTSWFWTSDTNVAVTATGDVNGDGKAEIVTAGYYNDGTRWVTQLVVWNASTLTAINAQAWYWTLQHANLFYCPCKHYRWYHSGHNYWWILFRRYTLGCSIMYLERCYISPRKR